MQSISDLDREVCDLATATESIADSVEVISSAEPWNPIAAVDISGLRLPASIRPRRTDLRIPIPDLYGFAASAAVAVTKERIECLSGGKDMTVPFCVQVDEATLRWQHPFYVDVRENGEFLLGRYTTCVTPSALPERFVHLPLPGFFGALIDFLENPVISVQGEIEKMVHAASATGLNVAAALRLAHLLESVGECDAAMGVLSRGLEIYPRNPWLRHSRERLQRRDE